MCDRSSSRLHKDVLRSPAVLMTATRFIRALVNAALGPSGTEAVLIALNSAVPLDALLDCLVLADSGARPPAMSILASLAAAGIRADLASACCDAVALAGPDEARNCDVKFSLSRLMVVVLP